MADSIVTVTGSSFIENSASHAGGAIDAYNSSVNLIGLQRNDFRLNEAVSSGGAIECKRCKLKIAGSNSFTNNTAKGRDSLGGALRVIDAELLILNTTDIRFSGNTASKGGGIYLYSSTASIFGDVTFTQNTANSGGAIGAWLSSLMTDSKLHFSKNEANSYGGAISMPLHGVLVHTSRKVLLSGKMLNNKARYGGAVFVERAININIENITVVGNSGTGLWIIDSIVNISGNTSIANNTGITGGGVFSRDSLISFKGSVLFHSNTASFGGAIYSLYGTISLSGKVSLAHNMVTKDGGALYATGTTIAMKKASVIIISSSSARNGGGVYLRSGAFVSFQGQLNFTTSHNHALEYGGAVYHEDQPTSVQCAANVNEFEELPYCFLRFKFSKRSLTLHVMLKFVKVYSSNDTAGKGGAFLFGGLLDKCQYNGRKDNIIYNFITNATIETQDCASPAVASKPYSTCFCDRGKLACSESKRDVSIYRGQTFRVSVMALAQGGIATGTVITAILSPTARLEVNQSIQIISKECTTLAYNIYSRNTIEQVILYPEGACYARGLAAVTINVIQKSCPDALTLSGDLCVCEERLQEYGGKCRMEEEDFIVERIGSEFWFTTVYENGTYQGLILYNTCPLRYCKEGDMTISLGNPDTQCDHNHSGLLCAACAANFSLLLGSSRCEVCSDAYLALVLPIAVAGVFLVILLSILRLTVATGMINGVIFYVNILQANRNSFLKASEVNVLTIFIAWLNLDLGIETCFYNGMTAYVQTWLQFLFPLYVWILISLIIVASRHSITVSRLVGHNPIAVLATLLLMSYNKILKIIVEVYSYARLSYPQNEFVMVWLKDPNIPYLRSWHLFLAIVTSLVLIFLFLPFTLLLLLGYKIHRFFGSTLHRRLKPLLDAYYAPFKGHTRYWTGFLLVVRCSLYIVFSFSSLRASSLVLALTLTVSVVKAWRIYDKFYLNFIESSIYLNLIVLSMLTLADYNSTAMVYVLIAIVFITAAGLSLFQFHVLYFTKLIRCVRTTLCKQDNSLQQPGAKTDIATSVCPTSTTEVSTTFIELREPLLDD
jgi:predicted outer membrane repeat protein